MSRQYRFVADFFKDLLRASFFASFFHNNPCRQASSHHPLSYLISVLIFESVDEILRCDNSNETSSAAVSVGVICF